MRPLAGRETIVAMTEELPEFDADDLTTILIILMRIEAKLDLLLEEDNGEEEDRP